MKVIDLLNKIANGEEVPKEIYYGCSKYTYDDYITDYKNDIGIDLFAYLFSKTRTNCFINDEVEIIEEDKKIKKLDLKYDDIIYGNTFKEEILMYCDNLQTKINEIIDCLEEDKK